MANVGLSDIPRWFDNAVPQGARHSRRSRHQRLRDDLWYVTRSFPQVLSHQKSVVVDSTRSDRKRKLSDESPKYVTYCIRVFAFRP